MQSTSFPTARNFKGRGPRSLVSMCTRVLALNIDKTCATDIKELPYQILDKVLYEVKLLNGRSKPLPLGTWVTMSEALRDAHSHEKTLPMELYRHRETIKVPRDAKLPIYTLPLFKLGTEYLVSLKIDGLPGLDTPELIPLAGLRNLDSLEIIENLAPGERGVLTDRLVRAWSEVKDAFPALTFLRLRPGHEIVKPTLTTHSLQYISAFPRLRVFNIEMYTALRSSDDWKEFDGMHEQDSCGWECVSTTTQSCLLHPDNLDAHLRFAGNFYTHPYIDHLPAGPSLYVYDDNRCKIVPAPAHGDANPSPRAHLADQPCRRFPNGLPHSHPARTTYSEQGSTWLHGNTGRPETHYQAFWRCALMDSAPPLCQLRPRPDDFPEDCVLPAKPHVSVILNPEDAKWHGKKSDEGIVYVLHRRAKLPPSGRRGLIADKWKDPSTMGLSWLQLEEYLAQRAADEQWVADEARAVQHRNAEALKSVEDRERGEAEGGTKMPTLPQKREAPGERPAVNARLARQRRKLGVSNMGDLFKGMQEGRPGGGSGPDAGSGRI